MNRFAMTERFCLRAWALALPGLVLMAGSGAARADAQAAAPAAAMTNGDMSHMSGHMYMTTLRPVKDGDRQKADAQGARGTEVPLLRSRCQIRLARLHHDPGSVRGGGRGVPSAHFRMDGARVYKRATTSSDIANDAANHPQHMPMALPSRRRFVPAASPSDDHRETRLARQRSFRCD